MDTLFDETAEKLVRPTMAKIRERPKNGLTCVGSFSGCGGSTLGLKMAGWDVLGAIEFIPAAAETYRANFPETQLWERDIREVDPRAILDALGLERGELDLGEGSPPCASFSAAGMGERGWGEEKAYSDTRQRTDDLFEEWERVIVDGLYPRAFVAENVPGMLTGKALEEYAWKTSRRLGTYGYRVSAKVLNSANYGVPQERRRLIFVGIRKDQPGDWEYPRPTVHVPHTLRQALESVDPAQARHLDDLPESSMVGKAVGRTWEVAKGLRDKSLCARCDRPLADHDRLFKKVGSVKKTKEAAGEQRETSYVVCADGEKGIEVKDYFLLTVPDLDEPCPTLTATGSQVGAASVVHPTECRKFTPAEAMAICGFPPDFVLTGPREKRYERMGRAVPPPLYEALGRKLAEVLG